MHLVLMCGLFDNSPLFTYFLLSLSLGGSNNMGCIDFNRYLRGSVDRGTIILS